MLFGRTPDCRNEGAVFERQPVFCGGVRSAKLNGIDPGAVIYTHVSGRYGPFRTRVISATMKPPMCSTDCCTMSTRRSSHFRALH